MAQLHELSDVEIKMQLALGSFSLTDLWYLINMFRGTSRGDTELFTELTTEYAGILLKAR